MTAFPPNAGRRKLPALLAGLAVMLCWNTPAGAQDLELFEDVERTVSANNRRGGGGNENASAPASLTEPEFTLVGASRIGDRRQVMLNHRGGETLTVPLPVDGAAAIPGHERFRVIASEAGRVAIQYPAGSNCVEAADLGVSCDAGANVAWLSLRPAPVPEEFIADLNASDADAEEQGQNPDRAAEAADAAAELARDPNNPFARLRAEALGEDVPPASRFRPRRINPDQVPPGMRVVSTPFGDRLVEID
ncbi:MAG: hypothetical protein OXE54_01635 [Gammaproteobacteria bacterium]|nr:hypothetical protein [Gammaproteobacteria bacterium]